MQCKEKKTESGVIYNLKFMLSSSSDKNIEIIHKRFK